MDKNLLSKLKRTVEWASKSAFYKEKLQKANLSSTDIKSLEDFSQFPSITSPDMREYSSVFPAVPREMIYALYASGGTTGKPKLMYYTEEALELVASATSKGLARIFPDTKGKLAVLICPADNLAAVGEYTKRALRNLGIFSGSMGLTYTPEQVKELVEVMAEEKPYLIIGNPARLLRLIGDIKLHGIDPKKLGVKYVLSTSEVLTDKTRQFVAQSFGAKVYQGGGMTEVGWSSMEGPSADGQHILDNVYAEVVDLHTGKLISEGTGELYLTTLINSAYPLVRYKTEDIVRVTSVPQDGIAIPRIWYKCRISEKIQFAEGEVYAYQIDDALESVKEVTSAFSLILDGADFVLRVETEKDMQTEAIKKDVMKKIIFSVGEIKKLEVILVDVNTLERSTRGKVKNRMIKK
jgi:phenylacetate-CoA ligase